MSNLSHPFRWLQCPDGSLPSLLDFMHTPFPNRGTRVLPKNSEVCWEAKPFEPPIVLQSYIEQYDLSNPLHTLSQLYDCVICLLVSSVICIGACVLIHYILNKVHTKFALITPSHKKWYVVVNVMKGSVLGLMIANFKFLPGAFKVVFGGKVPVLEAKRTTALYVMTDLVGMVLVRKLPLSTIMHHIMTVLIGMGIWFIDIGAETWVGVVGVTKMSFLYGAFSCIPFVVNIFLGLRVLYAKNFWMIVNCYIGLIAYITAIGFNWSLHLSWLYHCLVTMDISLCFFLYAGILIHIIRDDVILVMYLWRYSTTDEGPKKIE